MVSAFRQDSDDCESDHNDAKNMNISVGVSILIPLCISLYVYVGYGELIHNKNRSCRDETFELFFRIMKQMM